MDNLAQAEYWNGDAGAKWVKYADQLDELLAPFADAVLERAAIKPGERVLDIGCGAGALSLKAAQAVGDTGSVQGVDISEQLAALARHRGQERNARASFEVADASTFKSQGPVDVILSRFGVMFFTDPPQAFENIRTNLSDGGRMVFACWQSLAQNDWASAALNAALPFLPEPPVLPQPGSPGPFAFADPERVTKVLNEAGWQSIDIKPWTGDLVLPGTTADEIVTFMLELGPTARLLSNVDVDQTAVLEALQGLVSERSSPDGRLRLPAAAWIVSATA